MHSQEEIREFIFRELPRIIENDPEVQRLIISLSRRHFADRERTEDRIDRILDELRADRERQEAQWQKQTRKWDEQEERWKEQTRKWAENEARWQEQTRKWAEEEARWQEQSRKWDEQDKKWWANQKVIQDMLADIKALSRKHDTTIGALGARWGLNTEQSFRNALKGILEEVPGVEVFHVTEFDDSGRVFGHPEQIELDLIVRNGMLIIAEIKSSVSKADIYIMERKARFYEQLHTRKASRIMVISPMVDVRARPVAEKLGLEIYTSADDVVLTDV